MSEHTPGPWKVDSKYCVGPVSQEDDQSYGMIIPVADVYGPNRKADAELIASAPQLREQNRVLASHLNNLVEWALEVTKDWTVDDDSTLANDLRMIWQAQAAITATSQEGQHGSRT